MKKKLLIILSGLVVLTAAGLFSGYRWLAGRFEKDAVIAQMEIWWNCRATLDSSTVNLLTTPATVELKGLKLAPRDGDVAKPLAERGPFPDQAVLFSADQATLSVTLQDLLSRRYNIEELAISKLNVRTDINEEGDSSLDLMFDSPPDIIEPEPVATSGSAGSEPPKTGEHVAETPVKAEKKKEKKVTQSADAGSEEQTEESEDDEPFKASDLGMALQVKKASINEATLEMVDHKNDTHVTLSNVQLTLSNIDVNPANLSAQNRCDIAFDGGIEVTKLKSPEVMANFRVLGSGTWNPFDPATGVWFPDLHLDVTVKKDSQLGGDPLESQMREKDMKKMKDYGLDLSGLAIGGILQEDLVTGIHAMGSKLIIGKDTDLVFPDYRIQLAQKSWINASEDEHRLNGKLTASSELSDKILSGAEKKLGEKYGETMAALAQATVQATLMDEEKRLVLPFRSKGKLSKPDVSLDTAISDIADSLKNAGKSLLDSLLGN